MAKVIYSEGTKNGVRIGKLKRTTLSKKIQDRMLALSGG